MTNNPVPTQVGMAVAALRPIDGAEMETVEGGLMGELLLLACYLYKYGFIPPLV